MYTQHTVHLSNEPPQSQELHPLLSNKLYPRASLCRKTVFYYGNIQCKCFIRSWKIVGWKVTTRERRNKFTIELQAFINTSSWNSTIFNIYKFRSRLECKFSSFLKPRIDSNLKLEFGGWLGEGTGFILLNLNANTSLIQLPSLAHFSSLHYYAWLDSFSDILTNKFNSKLLGELSAINLQISPDIDCSILVKTMLDLVKVSSGPGC